MKYVLALLILLLVAAGLLLLNPGLLLNPDEQGGDEPVTGLPWQIDRLPGGDTRVFGITIGRTTLGDAIDRLGDDLELAIIAAPQETGALEAYYSHYSAGPITGSLVLVLDVATDTLRHMRSRAVRDGGTRRYLLHPDDLPVAYRAPVGIITFMPTFSLSDDSAQARFGEPAEVVQADAQQRHWLYPDRGLDLVLNADGRDLLQYLPPRNFGAHREQLRQTAAAAR